MAAHDSILPGEEKPKTIRIDSTGGSLSWKGWGYFIGSILTVVLGGGTIAGVQLVTKEDLQASEQIQSAKVAQVEENVKRDIGSINAKIGDLDTKVVKVQSYQIKQDARQEARRLTETIKDRDEREEEYDRLRELNVKRLEEGKDPCATLQCSN
jgi:ABC-type phosphate transport system auxiliary subunit